jgi:hypothetical protein
MLHNLEVIAGARHAEGKRVLLVVDEAQNLPPRSVEELRMLSNFQMDGKSLFQSFLLGQEEFKRTIQRPGLEQVRQRIIASYHLEPLGKEETMRYIEFRLGQVGWNGDPEISVEAFSEIHQFTSGIPRKINSLCDRLMLYGCLEELHHLGLEPLRAVIEEITSENSESYFSDDSSQADLKEKLDHTNDSFEMSFSSARDWENTHQEPEEPSRSGSLEDRLYQVERELKNLRKIMNSERKLLRKAILLQLEMDDIDELD